MELQAASPALFLGLGWPHASDAGLAFRTIFGFSLVGFSSKRQHAARVDTGAWRRPPCPPQPQRSCRGA